MILQLVIAFGAASSVMGCAPLTDPSCAYMCGAIGLPAKMTELDGDCICGEQPASVYGDRRRKEHH